MPISSQSLRKAPKRAMRFGLVFAALLVCGGCGGFDGVELKGKVFDVIGANGSGDNRAPTMERRAGLVTPPSLERLPNPDEKQPSGDEVLASIADPDRINKEAPEELMRRQKEYCDIHYAPAVARGDDTAASIEGPAGPCRQSVMTAIEKLNAGSQ